MKNSRIAPYLFLLLIIAGCGKEKKTISAALKMQDFVIAISAYARSIDPGFIIVPQNGEELAWVNAEPSEALNQGYLNAIDGFGIEELFYNGDAETNEYRLENLRQLVSLKKIMVSEYVANDPNIADAVSKNGNEGFICFARAAANYDYTAIPASVTNESAADILTLNDAQNYLYLISNSNYESKQDMIDAIASTNFDLIIIDLFFEDDPFTNAEINEMKWKANGGQRLVLAYMSIGSAENYRYYWQDNWKLHHPKWLKKKIRWL